MRHSHRTAQKQVDYPGETAGSRLAVKARKLASKLRPEQRRARFNKGMAMSYGGANAKRTNCPPIHPGEILREEFMKPRSLSQNALARALNVPPRRIN